MKSIYTYYDYRRYISDFYQEKKSQNPNYSFRYIAGKVGIDHALVIKIMQGDRHLGSKKVATFASFLGLSSRQTDYFKLLVAFGKAKDNESSKHYFEKILSFCDIGEKKIAADNYEFYQRWYYTAVREVLNITPFCDDYTWLANAVRPAISIVEAKKAVKLLEQLGMISKDISGYYRLNDQFITTGSDWQSIAIRTFQKESCTLALQAIDSTPREERDISTVTLTLNDEGLARLRDVLANARREIIEIASSCHMVDRVYQMNLQLFPISEKINVPPVQP